MDNKLTARQKEIIAITKDYAPIAISQIKEKLQNDVSLATLNRDLAVLIATKALLKKGKGRAITYDLSPHYQLFEQVDMAVYFQEEPDKRKALSGFNFDVFELLKGVEIFSKEEKTFLHGLNETYQKNVAGLSPTLYKREMERLTIEFSWKSSQIEGNTYSLLETEKLFLEREMAKNKSKEDAVMLLNHKYTLDFILKNRDIGAAPNLKILEEVHSLLIKDLGVGKNIRKRAVGITGTVYKPLDNAFQIREYLQNLFVHINGLEDVFERAFLSILLISYIQPFEDGNKRTGRMMGNALLMSSGACPLSYRSVDSIDYKKAILLFYERNNLFVFKRLFIDQVHFAVMNYFQ